jgi:hypothetical protein
MVTEKERNHDLELAKQPIIRDVDDFIYGDEPAYVSER